MGERRSDTEETFGSQDATADVSNQNAEEPSAPHGAASSSRRPGPPSRSDADDDAADDDDDDDDDDEQADRARPGAASEESQATGHPSNAG